MKIMWGKLAGKEDVVPKSKIDDFVANFVSVVTTSIFSFCSCYRVECLNFYFMVDLFCGIYDNKYILKCVWKFITSIPLSQ